MKTYVFPWTLGAPISGPHLLLHPQNLQHLQAGRPSVSPAPRTRQVLSPPLLWDPVLASVPHTPRGADHSRPAASSVPRTAPDHFKHLLRPPQSACLYNKLQAVPKPHIKKRVLSLNKKIACRHSSMIIKGKNTVGTHETYLLC